ncbi:MAG: hypothetical protein K8T26_01745 [Lentisphaerae bacterium]|nr:hypothetical protein [Lentisphaerota bacterium]
MAEQLESLLERIQKDGVDKAQAEAKRMVAQADQQAAEIIRKAEARAAELVQKAEKDSQAFAERGRVALQQAARDVLISLADAVNRTLATLVSTDVKQALDPQTLGRILEQVTSVYVQAPAGQQRLEVLLAPEQQQAIRDYFTARLAQAMRAGIEIKGDGRVLAGFRVSVVGQSVQHDFSEPAITASLCELLRPHMAQIVRDAARKP